MLRKQPSLAVAPLCALTRCLSGREALNKTKTGPSSTRYRIPSLHALPFGQRSPQQDQNWSRQHSLSHPPRCTRYLHFHRIRYHSLRHSLPLTRLCVCAVCIRARGVCVRVHMQKCPCGNPLALRFTPATRKENRGDNCARSPNHKQLGSLRNPLARG